MLTIGVMVWAMRMLPISGQERGMLKIFQVRHRTVAMLLTTAPGSDRQVRSFLGTRGLTGQPTDRPSGAQSK
jgi:hypothetical protein